MMMMMMMMMMMINMMILVVMIVVVVIVVPRKKKTCVCVLVSQTHISRYQRLETSVLVVALNQVATTYTCLAQ